MVLVDQVVPAFLMWKKKGPHEHSLHTDRNLKDPGPERQQCYPPWLSVLPETKQNNTEYKLILFVELINWLKSDPKGTLNECFIKGRCS